MKEIVITKGFKVKVDDEDFESLNQFRWYTVDGARTYYAYKDDKIRGEITTGKQTAMHRLILNITDDNIKVDHIDGDGLNNQKYNLRTATNQQNCFNVPPKHSNKTVTYKGVYKTEDGTYEAQIKLNYKSKSLGRYKTAKYAAKIYDAIARYYMGEYAWCNFEEQFIKPMSIEVLKEKLKIRKQTKVYDLEGNLIDRDTIANLCIKYGISNSYLNNIITNKGGIYKQYKFIRGYGS